MLSLTYQQRLSLAAAAKVSLGTTNKWLSGRAVTAANDAALLRAVSELGLAKENEEQGADDAR